MNKLDFAKNNFRSEFICGKVVDRVDKKIIYLKTEYIRLDQLLKWASLVSTGGEGKFMIEEGKVLVNEEIEIRRGRKIFPGDQVRLKENQVMVSSDSNFLLKNE